MNKINIKIKNRKEINFNKPLYFQTSEFRYFKGHEDEKIFIYDKPDTSSVRSRGCALSMITSIQLGFESAYLVVVDEEFMKLPEEARNFFLWHEYGHFYNGHFNQIISSKDTARLIIKRSLGLLPKMEVEADLYAASVVGPSAAINSLLYLVKNSNAPLMSKIEMIRRAFKIKRESKKIKHH